jgi:hypothetical protein
VISTPIELTIDAELNVEVQRFTDEWLFPWHGMTYEGGKTDVDNFRGGRISYTGVKFDDQKRSIFWHAIDTYLRRKIHDVFKQWEAGSSGYSLTTRRGSIEGVERTLRRFASRIMAHAVNTDRALRGGGYPESVAAYDPQIGHTYAGAEISNLAAAHRILLDEASPMREPELLTLKPGLWGMSFDVKAAFRRFSGWRKNRSQK